MHVYNLDATAFVRLAVASRKGLGSALAPERQIPEVDGPSARDSIAETAEVAELAWPNHILLNLPSDAWRFLTALQSLCGVCPDSEAPMVHCYAFSKHETEADLFHEAHERVCKGLGFAPAQLTVRTVRSVAPRKQMLCYTFRLIPSTS
jgi:tRNA G37 N-methylase Trm5